MKEFIKKYLVHLILTAVLIIPIIILFLNKTIAWLSFWVLFLNIMQFFIYFCIAIVLNVIGFIGVMKNKPYSFVSFLPLVYGGLVAACTVNKNYEYKKALGIFTLVNTFIFAIYPLTIYCLYEFGYYHIPSA